MSTAQALVFGFVAVCILLAGVGLFALAAPMRAAYKRDGGVLSRPATVAFFAGPPLVAVGLAMLIVLGSFVTR